LTQIGRILPDEISGYVRETISFRCHLCVGGRRLGDRGGEPVMGVACVRATLSIKISGLEKKDERGVYKRKRGT